MILDKISNARLYRGLSPRLDRALSAMADCELMGREDGRYPIDGDRLIAIVQRYTSRPISECKFEAHKKYIDVQVIVRGEEKIGHANVQGQEVAEAYDETKDAAFYKPTANLNWLRLPAGSFAVFFPEDAHQPCVQADGPSQVHKVVFKVRVGE